MIKFLDLVQGTQVWHDERMKRLTASEAPAIMNASKFMSRNELLDLKAGWKANSVAGFQQSIYDKGHEQEDLARAIKEVESCEDFPPKVVVRSGHEFGLTMDLLASYDGLEGGELHGTPWEHKGFNKTLAENVRNGLLEPHYYWQLEAQMLINNTKYVEFTCSDGGTENKETMVYASQGKLRLELIAGYKQFISDLEGHELKAKTEKVVAVKVNIPVITFSVAGTEISTNLSECLDQVKELATTEMDRKLETDQDFANKDQLNKDVKLARVKLKEVVEKIRGKFVSYATVEDIARDYDVVLQKMQAHGEKQVKDEKTRKKESISHLAHEAVTAYENLKSELLPEGVALGQISFFNADFITPMKGKRNISSCQDAVDGAVAQTKIEIDTVMAVLLQNFEFLEGVNKEYRCLFNDILSIVNQPPESFQAVIKSRISDHKEAEEKRLQADRERIRLEEEAKAQQKADSLAEEAREKIRKEEREKAQEIKAPKDIEFVACDQEESLSGRLTRETIESNKPQVSQSSQTEAIAKHEVKPVPRKLNDQTIIDFLQGQFHDVADFGYLLISDNPQHNAEAMSNLRAKFQVFIGNK